jgi:predicted TIM-barrel fold metal-dependent hydrolase
VIIDAYNCVWGTAGSSDYLTHTPRTAEALLSVMDAQGVDIAVITGLGQLMDNQYLVDACARHPDRFVGMGQADPRKPDAIETIRHFAANAGMKALKLHPTMHGYHVCDHGLLDPVFEVAAELGLVVLINALDDPFCAPLSIEEIAKHFPTVPTLIAHSGVIWNVMEAILVASRTPNLYLETSATQLIDVETMYRMVGAEKIVMGTDWPCFDFEMELLKLRKAIPDEQDRAKVTGGNLADLLGISETAGAVHP